MKEKVRIATRNSPLALWQANFIKERLLELYPECLIEIIGMTTKGDQMLDSPLAKIGGKGLFVKELEVAIKEDRADLAVHSMKDVGVQFPDGLGIHAVLERHSPFDAMVSNEYNSLADLPDGSIIGTCSLRRIAQLKYHFPNFVFKSLRGNVNTRLAKLDSGEFSAIILAKAGLNRLGMDDRISEVISADISLPAISQGALGIECRNDDYDLISMLTPLIDEDTELCVKAERAVNEVLNGSCQTPIAAYATTSGDTMTLNALVGDIEEGRLIYSEVSGMKFDAHSLGIEAGEYLLKQGAKEILEKVEQIKISN